MNAPLRREVTVDLPHGCTAVYAMVPQSLDFRQKVEVLEAVHAKHGFDPWLVGDLLCAGEWPRGTRVAEVRRIAGPVAKSTVEMWAYVARHVVPEDRRPGLSWSHHLDVAGLPREQQRRFLDQAERDGLTSYAFRGLLRAYKAERKAASR